MQDNGTVYLVGAGPGDPDLLTIKALRLLQQADVVVLDRLISPEVLALIGPRCECHYVGKRTNRHTLEQTAINQLLVTLSRRHQCVVRLKGGDPFIFGRGGEEAQALVEAGVRYEIVPGITSAQACAAYAGIPLTHRGIARGVQFITGHFMKNAPLSLSPTVIADPSQTLVVYMGLENVKAIVQALSCAGRDGRTPAAVVESGTTCRQRTIVTTLDHLPSAVEYHDVQAPAVLIIGHVVALADVLDWFSPDDAIQMAVPEKLEQQHARA